MLKDSFYTITSRYHQDDTIVARLEFEPSHEIYKGHFPGQPVAPGACMLQMAKEILSDALSAPYRLKIASNLKFIAPVDPRMVDEAELKLTYKTIDAGLQVIAVLTNNGVVCFKMQGIWVMA